jgi:hypothetical protein
VDVIVGRGYCDVCDGTVAIAPRPRGLGGTTAAPTKIKATHTEITFDADDGLVDLGEWKLLSPAEAARVWPGRVRRA